MVRAARPVGPPEGGGGRAVDLVLEAAERHCGMGRGVAAPSWVRDRVLALLEQQAARRGLTLQAAAQKIAAERRTVEEIVAVLRVGETRFYRDPVYWEAIARTLLPMLPLTAPIAGLSAGCSTGEEAYTLGMVLARAGRRFSVLGVDRSPDAVDAAREGLYSAEAARALPPDLLDQHCDVGGGALRIRDALRTCVTFEVCDLVQDVPWGPFQIILFRNVLLYLAAPAGETVARRLATELGPRGLLFSAASETTRLRDAGLVPVRLDASVTGFRAPGARAPYKSQP